ncbi:MAG TPA: tRNA uridine-5-carboxymethylaminomethyl(34) synthesis GTPase MnmE [Burkholderiales bacterium]|nr:tRNA uridine-5-carboxymethylaminomethyl(34) synthesis GTPase MnmE [Burkholderiales bacterium]
MTQRDTIAAIATAPGRAGIGVVRVSGESARQVMLGIVGRCLEPRHAAVVRFRDAKGAPIDEGVALYFAGPQSYTGEDVFELQGHGGSVVLQLLLQRCVELGARMAEPGEFTRRAYLNGKLDLAQAESVVDLIDAATTHAARSALRSLQGEFSSRINEVKASVVELRARVEAALDFPEEDVDVLENATVREGLAEARAALETVLAAAARGSVLREGLHLVIAGRPNVGKSSLLNQLAGAELAIVTDIPGTTRDPVREALAVGGIPVHVVDTAGLRDTTDPVERIGVERAWDVISKADAVMLVADATSGMGEADMAILRRMPPGLKRLRVMNKIDLIGREPTKDEGVEETVLWLSARTGAGIDLLRSAILELAGWQHPTESAFLARERHLAALRAAQIHLATAAAHTAQLEFFAEELRLAQEQLSLITGEFTADDLLGEIFSRFCIGK